jgi:hypothetical protein
MRAAIRIILATVVLAVCGPTVLAADGDVLLIRRDLSDDEVRVVEFNDQKLVCRDEKQGWVTLEIDKCIGFIAADPGAPMPSSVLLLADGQRFPGRPARQDQQTKPGLFMWEHTQLGRLAFPLETIQAVVLDPAAQLPAQHPEDVIVLRNGDQLQGLIVALGAQVQIEVDVAGEREIMAVPLERIGALRLVTQPKNAEGRRVWLSDGTVLDASRIHAGDDGHVRLTRSPSGAGTQPVRLGLKDINAILFDPASLVPLAQLVPTRIDGPETRYLLPEPEILDRGAPLGLSRVRLRGPLTVRYALPEGTKRFAAEAVLPSRAHRWGDYEMTVYDDDRPVFSAKLSADTPRAVVNVALSGTELNISLVPAGNGPIQDELILERAILLVK